MMDAKKAIEIAQSKVEWLLEDESWAKIHEALWVVKNVRIQLLSSDITRKHQEWERAYAGLISHVHGVIMRRIAIASDHSTVFAVKLGKSSFYTVIVDVAGRRMFLKVTDLQASSESAFFHAASRGLILTSGTGYQYQIPEAIIDTPAARIHVFPALEDIEPARLALDSAPERIQSAIYALTETIASVGHCRYDQCPRFLPKKGLMLPGAGQKKLRSSFPELSDREAGELHRRLLKLRARWKAASHVFRDTAWGFAHGDLASGNVTIVRNTLVFLDMGQTCFAPLGTDLYWMLYYSRREPAAEEWIVSKFKEALAAHDIHIEIDELRRNAVAQYCRKWLTPSKARTSNNLSHFESTLDRAETLLRNI